MKIELAGFNVDAEILCRLNQKKNEILTPETLSAAYARISRSSDDINLLRKKAIEDVERSRKSNKTIIFEMGHHSIAEHAVFNFDISGVSRMALEEIERFRLSSYTEKSQRYVTLKGDYVIPKEIGDQNSIETFRDIIHIQNRFYQHAFAILKKYTAENYSHLLGEKNAKSLLEGWAKEDARYILSLATEGQLGMTINARNAEHLLRRFASSENQEIKDIGEKIYFLIKKIAPSIILFPEPSAFDLNGQKDFKHCFPSFPDSIQSLPDLQIIHHTPDGDDVILAAFISVSQSQDFSKTYGNIKKMSAGTKKEIFKNLFQKMEFFDSPPREFELVTITFQAIISASNFAQLKRHRMATLIYGDYKTGLGNTIPQSILNTGLIKEFSDVIRKTNQVHKDFKTRYGKAADYILTNSHRRMVIMKMNLREMYHFVRLRDDEHAQWDIKSLAHRLADELKKIMPLSSLLLCGKSDFFSEYEKIYESRPKFSV